MYEIDGLHVLSSFGKWVGQRTRDSRLALLGSDRLLQSAQMALFVAACAAGLFKIGALARINLHPDPATFTNAATVQASDWVAQNTRASDVVMDDEYAIVHRLTKRRTGKFNTAGRARAAVATRPNCRCNRNIGL